MSNDLFFLLKSVILFFLFHVATLNSFHQSVVPDILIHVKSAHIWVKRKFFEMMIASISRSSKFNVIASFHYFISQAKLEKLVISTKKQPSTSFYRFLFFVKNIQYLKIYSFVFPYSLQKPSSCCKNLLHVSPTVSPRQSF